jgi:Zn-dependent protease
LSRDERDSRIDLLEEDFFKRTRNNTSNTPDSNQHVRVIIKQSTRTPSSAAFLRGFMDNIYFQQPVQKHEGSFWHFSKRELNDLALATLAFGLALAFMQMGGIFGILSSGGSLFAVSFGMIIWGTLYILALGPAFIIHELAHKYLARHYGCWAEFRADPQGLKTGILIAALLGIVFMAPGAVMVAGNITKQQNGKIALVGPISNMVLFIIGLIGGGLLLGLTSNPFVAQFVMAWLWGNSVLAAFNMIPYGPLDGRKVKDWSETIFWIFMISTLGLAFATITGRFDSTLEIISAYI